MTKQHNLQSLFCGILFCLSITALIIACLAFEKKGGKGEYYGNSSPASFSPSCCCPPPRPLTKTRASITRRRAHRSSPRGANPCWAGVSVPTK